MHTGKNNAAHDECATTHKQGVCFTIDHGELCLRYIRDYHFGLLAQASRVSHFFFPRLNPHVRCTKDLADSVDLRTRDAFGRNPLYYTCLCGHVCAAHFVVVRAYGGVEVRRLPPNPAFCNTAVQNAWYKISQPPTGTRLLRLQWNSFNTT